MANEDVQINEIADATEITNESRALGVNDAGETVMFQLSLLRGSKIGNFKTTDSTPVSPMLNQYYDLIGTGDGASPSGTYINLLTAASTPLVVPTPSAGHAILYARAFFNGTFWVRDYQDTALPNSDLTNYYNKTQVDSGFLTSTKYTNEVSPITAPTTSPAGMNPVAIGTSSFGDGGNKACVIGVWAGIASVLYSVTAYINILGSGVITLVRLSGTAPALTVISKVALSVSATGIKTFTSADFGTITLNSGDTLAFEFTNGGATVWTKTETGNTAYYLNGSTPTGTQTWTTISNTRYCAGFALVTGNVVSLPRAYIAPAFETQISAVEKNSNLVNPMVSTGLVYAGQNPVQTGPSLSSAFGTGGNRYANADTYTGVAGFLQSVTLNVVSLGDGLINIVRASGVLPSQTFISRKAVTLTNIGVQVITFADNEIPMNPGDSINVEFPTTSGGVTIGAMTETGHTAYFKTGGLMSGTVTMSAASNARYYLGYAVTVPKIAVANSYLNPQLLTDVSISKDPKVSRARTILYDFAFGSGPGVPSPWTAAGSWTVSGGYLISPSGSPGMGVYATDNTQINVQESTRRIVINAMTSGTIIGIAGRVGGVADTNLGSLFTINYTNNTVNIHAAWIGNTTTQPSVYSSTIAPFTLTVGVDYLVEVFRDRRNIWISVYDPISALYATVGNDGNAIVGSNFKVGEMGDYLEVINLAGQSKFRNPCVLVNKSNTGTYIVGDSLTEAYALAIGEGWAQLAAADVRSVTVISGRSGDKASGMGLRAVSEMHQILPKRSIFHGGTNDTGSGLTGFQTGFTAWLNQCIADGVKPCAVRLAQRTGGDVSAINAWLDTQGIPLIRADIATTTGFDGVTKNTACFVGDGIHYSTLGAKLVFQRIAVDFPYFYD
jgi:hypothetical protein